MVNVLTAAPVSTVASYTDNTLVILIGLIYDIRQANRYSTWYGQMIESPWGFRLRGFVPRVRMQSTEIGKSLSGS